MMGLARFQKLLFGALFLVICSTGLVWAADPTSETKDEDSVAEEAFAYNPAGRRDPFAPLVYQISAVPAQEQRTLGPLEKFELNEFRLLAMMIVKGAPHAMVKAPDGKSYTVVPGDLIGPNGGVVKRIETKAFEVDAETGLKVEKSPDRIVVEEVRVENFTGKSVKKEFYIEM